MTAPRPWRSRLALAALLAGGCGAGGGFDRGQAGTLGSGVFGYLCTDGDDAACRAQQRPARFPAAVAVGARFDLAFAADQGSPVTLQAAAPARLLVQQTTLTPQSPGYHALLAIATADQKVRDLVHVLARPASALLLPELGAAGAAGGTAPARLTVGDAPTVRAIPAAADGTELAGSLRYTWSSSAPTVVAVRGGDAVPTARVTLAALAAGTATITVSAGGVTRTVDVVVP